MPRVLAILAEGFEEIETVTPIDLLRRAGVEVVTAALTKDIHVVGRSGIVLHADTSLEKLAERNFDCLFLPGGPGVKLMRADRRIAELVSLLHEQGAWMAAICAAPTVLKDAGLLEGRRHTAHFSVKEELPQAELGMKVVVDGRIITSRGAGTSVDFGLSLVEHLCNPAKARDIASAICF